MVNTKKKQLYHKQKILIAQRVANLQNIKYGIYFNDNFYALF